MSSGERPGGEPFHAARLKPGDRRAIRGQLERALAGEPVLPDVASRWDVAAVSRSLDDLRQNGFAKDEPAAEECAARLVRIAEDHAHIERLRAEGFAGPRYELFTTMLALYGEPVVRAWIRRRQIWELTAANGRGVQCPPTVRDHLTHNIDDRRELTLEVVAHALRFFREHALLGRGWTVDGGANITTYFAGACVAVFPNVFRSWLREYEIGQRCLFLDVEQLDHLLDRRAGEGPEDKACLVDMFETALKAAARSERLQRVLAAMVLTDAQYAELARAEDVSEDAIKQLVYRFRLSGEGRTP